jgi:hypothetical protein
VKHARGKRACSFTRIGGILCLLLSGCGLERKEPSPGTEPSPSPAAEPSPTPLPETYVPYQKLDTATLFNGIKLYSEFETEEGGVATQERTDDTSFALELRMRVRVPRPNTDLESLAGINPALPQVLPALPQLVQSAKVSGFYHALYERKVKFMQSRLNRLDRLLSRHNFYDCETILEMEHPETNRKALFIQAEMDVDGDGSDGDRQLKVDQTSSTFQPFTSYRWAKRTQHPNEFLADRTAKLQALKEEYKVKGLSAARNRELRDSIAATEREIADLKQYSYLLSRADPFIVLPGFMVAQAGHPYRPQLGDYAVVIHGDKIYPAIFGDIGPSMKMGEASLRICREIDPKSGVYRRPESDLVVTYIVFPGTAEQPFGPPNLPRYKQRCEELLNEIGGFQGTMIEWEDLTMPVPSPTPTPSPTPATTASPVAAVSPMASPESSPATSPAPHTLFPLPSASPAASVPVQGGSVLPGSPSGSQ